MVSFQTPDSPNHRQHHSSKKRKWDERQPHRVHYDPVIKPWKYINPSVRKSTSITCSSAIDLHLEFPLPSDWQRCLDIQSGEIHFYNTRTHKRTQRDPRFKDVKPLFSMTPNPPALLNLDLELNIAPGDHHSTPTTKLDDNNNPSTNNLTSSLAAADMDQQEMLATACKRCHLLVIVCKSYPACPNCKFVHPMEQGPLNLPEPRLGLLC